MGTPLEEPTYPQQMSTNVVRPRDPELRAALRLAAGFALAKLLLHLAMNLWQAHLGWGYFRDELYYLICGRHLAWGYVDHGPLVALQARLAESLFGRSLAGLRIFAALAGALRVFLTGMLAWSLGGQRAAQALAMIGVLVAGQYLGGDSYLAMNSFESLFWMSCLLALILIESDASRRLWLLFGLSAGLGLLNKPSMTFFLGALLIALLATPQRRLLRTPWMLAGVTLMLLIVAPYLHWQVVHHWPTLEFLQNGRAEHKNIVLGPLAFLNNQIQTMHPLNLLLWGAGLLWLLRRKTWRWLGLTWLIFLAGMIALQAKDYYVVPIYPILFAAGGLAWESRLAEWKRQRIFAFPLLEGALLSTGLLLLPMSNPILTPPAWLAYTGALHLRPRGNTENTSSGALPQFFADRFGWQEEVVKIRRVYRSLSPAEQQQTVILCTNYGEASAINFLAPDLPPAISGHNNYWLWGPGPKPATILIDVENTTAEHLQDFYSSVLLVDHMESPWSMPYEHRSIFLLRAPHQTMQALWLDKKMYL